jgi:RNA polymerase sigma factor (sigma-70 family)
MASERLTLVLDRIRNVIGLRDKLATPDASLLARFVAERDEAAFSEIVRRHGPMVLGVCRRVLSDEHEAEDAFQATFLVLVRRAASIGRRELLANWLFGVAQRVALKARGQAATRSTPCEIPDMPSPEQEPQAWEVLAPYLDEELGRLPERYRRPVVLCYLQSKTLEEAAVELGWSRGSVKGRLERARELLRSRFARRGVALPAAGLTAFLTTQTASAVPIEMMLRTVQGGPLFATGPAAGTISASAIALANKVLKNMVLDYVRKQLMAVGLVAVLVGAGAWSALAAGGPKVPAPKPAAAPQPEKARARLGYKERATIKAADVTHLAISPDGKCVATASIGRGPLDREVTLFEAETGKPRATLKSEKPCLFFEGFEFSSDGALLLVLRGDNQAKNIELWDVASATLKRVFKDRTIWAQGSSSEYLAAAFLPDGKRLVTLSRVGQAAAPNVPNPIWIEDSYGSLVVEQWDLASGKQLTASKKTFGSQLLLETAKWPGNKEVAAIAKELASDDAAKRQAAIIKFMDFRARQEKAPPKFAGARAPQGNVAPRVSGSKRGPRLLAVAPDGKSVAFILQDGLNADWPRIWNLATDDLTTLPCNGLGMHVDFSADSKALIVESEARGAAGGQISYTTEIWDLTQKKTRGRFSSLGFAVTSEGLLSADARGNVNLIDVESAQTKAGLAAHAAASATRVKVTMDPDPTGVLGLQKGRFVVERQGGIRDLVVTRDGKFMATVAEKMNPRRKTDALRGFGGELVAPNFNPPAGGVAPAPPARKKDPQANDWWEIRVWARTDAGTSPGQAAQP